MSTSHHAPDTWVHYNPLTATYDTPDGTRVAAELVDNVVCLADVLYIAVVRHQQHEASAMDTGRRP